MALLAAVPVPRNLRKQRQGDTIMSDTKPHNVYVIEEYKDQAGETQSLKTKVGSAFPHKSGGGFNIVLRQNLAVSGRLVVFPPRDDDSAEE